MWLSSGHVESEAGAAMFPHAVDPASTKCILALRLQSGDHDVQVTIFDVFICN
jgi:hypothetical protein